MRLSFSRVVLVSFILGGAWRLLEYKAWLPLRDYKVDAQSPVLEKRLWDVFPSRAFYFWPWFLRDAKNFENFLESDAPVSVQTQKLGFGKFRTVIKWLTPWLKIAWRGRVWCISRDGKMWDMADMPVYASYVKGPVWVLNYDKNNLDLNLNNAVVDDNYILPSGVFKSPIDTDIINKFVDEYQNYEWFNSAEQIVMDRRAGMNLFIIRLVYGIQNFEILIQGEKYAGQDLGAAIDDIIFNKLSKEGGDHIIDATYEGKILIRKLISSSKLANRKEGE